MALNASAQLGGVSQRLIKDGVLFSDDLDAAQQAATESGVSLISYLVENNIIEGRILADLLSEEFGMPVLDLSAISPGEIIAHDFPKNLIRQHHALPLFKRGSKVFIAMSDPMNLSALDAFQFHSGNNTASVLVEENKLADAIDNALDDSAQTLADMADIALDFDNEQESNGDEENLIVSNDEDTPVVRFVNQMISKAIKRGASDIHFEPYQDTYRVRARVDGVLQEMETAPTNLANRIVARIKVLSRLNIAERRLPQDGRMQLKLSTNHLLDFRVSTCPVSFGEKIVLRILDSSQAKIGIDGLGYEADQKQLFVDYIKKPYGMILITGPTGSGKTVSLYTALNILNTEDRNISTAEDPVEITMPGINQVNVHPDIGLDFASALRAFLRQDPDVIMVGEIRDLETAEIAIKAAQTGHLVLSTLHTNDAPQTLTRLANMGVVPFNIASAVSLIIAQRLGRRLCKNCKQVDKLPPETLLAEGFSVEEVKAGITLYKPRGCKKCVGGYKGRVGIYQVMPVSEDMQQIILRQGNARELEAQAEKEGILNLRQAGLKKVSEGIFGMEELNRITKE